MVLAWDCHASSTSSVKVAASVSPRNPTGSCTQVCVDGQSIGTACHTKHVNRTTTSPNAWPGAFRSNLPPAVRQVSKQYSTCCQHLLHKLQQIYLQGLESARQFSNQQRVTQGVKEAEKCGVGDTVNSHVLPAMRSIWVKNQQDILRVILLPDSSARRPRQSEMLRRQGCSERGTHLWSWVSSVHVERQCFLHFQNKGLVYHRGSNPLESSFPCVCTLASDCATGLDALTVSARPVYTSKTTAQKRKSILLIKCYSVVAGTPRQVQPQSARPRDLGMDLRELGQPPYVTLLEDEQSHYKGFSPAPELNGGRGVSRGVCTRADEGAHQTRAKRNFRNAKPCSTSSRPASTSPSGRNAISAKVQAAFRKPAYRL